MLGTLLERPYWAVRKQCSLVFCVLKSGYVNFCITAYKHIILLGISYKVFRRSWDAWVLSRLDLRTCHNEGVCFWCCRSCDCWRGAFALVHSPYF